MSFVLPVVLAGVLLCPEGAVPTALPAFTNALPAFDCTPDIVRSIQEKFLMAVECCFQMAPLWRQLILAQR